MIPYVSPTYGKSEFNCPHCHSFSDQAWSSLSAAHHPTYGTSVQGFDTSRCRKCANVAIWHKKIMIYPDVLTTPPPPKNLPPEVLSEYEEARNVLSKSPRASCALLRLCIEKMCDELEPGTSSLNNKIGKLVQSNKIDEDVQKALDAVRVIGDNAVHSLYMDLKDDTPIASTLFQLIDVIVQSTFTRKKLVEDVFNNLPENAKKAINQRDA